jgi:hypothetical protein
MPKVPPSSGLRSFFLLAGLLAIALVGLYQRNADATAEGLIEAIAAFFRQS